MDTLEPSSLSSPKALTLDLDVNVAQRLADLHAWITDWQAEDRHLCQRIEIDSAPGSGCDHGG